jgi:hypothetical protein
MPNQHGIEPYTQEQIDRFERLADQTHPDLSVLALDELNRWKDSCIEEVTVANLGILEKRARVKGSLIADIGAVGLGIAMQDKFLMGVGAGLALMNSISLRRYTKTVVSTAEQKIAVISGAVETARRHSK